MDTAIREIADKLVEIRDAHGGTSIAYARGELSYRRLKGNNSNFINGF